MAGRFPPLSTLRAFEAAARHLSFTQAAAELFMTQRRSATKLKPWKNGLA